MMQPVPEGYDPLNFVGFMDCGEYSSEKIYAENDIVHRNNTAWRCLIDGTIGIEPEEGENWTVFIASESDSSGITTTDTQGIVGEKGSKVSNQDLIDAIADRVINKLMEKSMMSGVQVDDENKVPTSALAYAMQQSIDGLNENLNSKAPFENPVFNGSVRSMKTLGPGPNAYSVAQFISETDGMNEGARCGYGFHNVGKNGGFLYLDFDGLLKFSRSDGTIAVIKFE